MQMAIVIVLGVLAFFVAILVIYIGGNWLLARFRPKPSSKESLQRYRERLRNPRWDELQEHFGQILPEPLKSLYRETALITKRDVVFRESSGKEWHVAAFYPADRETDPIWPYMKKSKIFPFAFDSFGDCYYVDLASKESNRCPVMYYHHDGNDVELVSESLEEFLGWNREKFVDST